MEWFRWEGTLRIISFQPLAMGRNTSKPHPNPETFQGWSSHSFRWQKKRKVTPDRHRHLTATSQEFPRYLRDSQESQSMDPSSPLDHEQAIETILSTGHLALRPLLLGQGGTLTQHPLDIPVGLVLLPGKPRHGNTGETAARCRNSSSILISSFWKKRKINVWIDNPKGRSTQGHLAW